MAVELMRSSSRSILNGDGTAPAFTVENENGTSSYLITCEHGSNAIPPVLGNLGISAEAMQTHIAWDIGATALAKRLSENLNAKLVLQNYSRLVIDANRPWGAIDLAPAISDGIEIPGNCNLSPADLKIRWNEIHQPYHSTISRLLDGMGAPQIVSIHSFAARLQSDLRERPWQISLSSLGDSRLMEMMLTALRKASAEIVIGINEPYDITRATDYTIPVHAVDREIPHVLVELRQDELENVDGIQKWADLLKRALPEPRAQKAKESSTS